MKKSTLSFIGIVLLGCTSSAFAWDPEPDYFIDHAVIGAKETQYFMYAIPSAQHFLQCNQDAYGAELGSIEWTYKGVTYKGQMGNPHRLTLVRDDMQHSGDEALAQFADAKGKLVITNLDSRTLTVSCRFSLTPY